MHPPVLVIANRNAAGGRAGRILPALEEALRSAGLEYSIEHTRAPGHARELALRAREGPSPILVVGGDGTIHEVATGLLAGTSPDRAGPTLPPLAVLSVGTGNDFSRMLRSPRGIPAVVRAIKEGTARPFEVGFARWDGGVSHFVNLAGIGIDAEVLKRRAAFTALRGLPQYLAALGSALVRYRPVRVRTLSSGPGDGAVRVEGEVLLAAVTVGPSIGGGFFLSPRARPDDGLLDFFLAENLGILHVVHYLPGILRGTLDNAPGMHRRQITQLEILQMEGKPFAFELDGELMPQETSTLDVQVQPGALRILESPAGDRV
ncbi:MAG: diacylglycerol kinase family lipid kinase [Gemmatimonadetes bacterium]|nr:diacylglycerol kinase family lipid kinase [Gemmatimonadota bacterium]